MPTDGAQEVTAFNADEMRVIRRALLRGGYGALCATLADCSEELNINTFAAFHDKLFPASLFSQEPN